MEESVFAIFFTVVVHLLLCLCFDCLQTSVRMEDIKPDPIIQIDLNKLCRTCLTENEQMRSVFVSDESTGQNLTIADMLMNFTNVQVNLIIY